MIRIVICGSYGQLNEMKDIKNQIEALSDQFEVTIPDPDLKMDLFEKRMRWFRLMDQADAIIGVQKHFDGRPTWHDYGESTSYEMAYAEHTELLTWHFRMVDGTYDLDMDMFTEYCRRKKWC